MLRSIVGFFLLAYRYRRDISLLQFIRLKFKSNNGGKGQVFEIRLKSSPFPFKLRARTSDDTIFEHIFLIKEYESFVVRDLNAVIIDAGANIGAASFYFKLFNPNIPLIAIEPDKSNLEVLKMNLSHFSGITILNAGLHSDSGIGLEIENPEAGHMGFRLIQNDSAEVKSVSLNQLVLDFNIKKIGLAKIDIEGGEQQVFSRHYDWLSICDYLVIELHDHYAPEASDSLVRALAKQHVRLKWRGENLICYFKNK